MTGFTRDTGNQTRVVEFVIRSRGGVMTTKASPNLGWGDRTSRSFLNRFRYGPRMSGSDIKSLECAEVTESALKECPAFLVKITLSDLAGAECPF